MGEYEKDAPHDAEFKGAGWLVPPIGMIDDADEAWPALEAGDLSGFMLRFSMFAMHMATKQFEKEGEHEVVFILVKGRDKLHVITEDSARGMIEGAGGPAGKLLLAMSGMHPKDLLAKCVAAATRAIDPVLVVHVSEAWMTTLPQDRRNDPEYKEMFDQLESGSLSLKELPDKYRTEVLIVRTETKDGKCVFLRRVITRDKDDKPTLGPVQLMEDMEETPESPGRGRFSDYWNPENSGNVRAIAVEVNAGVSRDAWKYDEEPEPHRVEHKEMHGRHTDNG